MHPAQTFLYYSRGAIGKGGEACMSESQRIITIIIIIIVTNASAIFLSMVQYPVEGTRLGD